ncbi:hypothetical protein ACJ41O_007423 [Fusarium nematophilum]
MPETDRQHTAVVLTFFFPALALVVVSLRVYGRVKTRKWGLDDFFCGLATLLALAMMGPTYIYIKLGYVGWHQLDIPQPYNPSPSQWWFYVAQMLHNPILALVKASILFYLLRLTGLKRSVRWSIHGLNILNALHAISVFFVALFQCLPIEANWDLEFRAHGVCIKREFNVVAGVLTVITDFLVLGVSFWIFMGLKRPVGTRAALIGAFAVGLGVITASLIWLVDICKVYYSDDNDPYYPITIVYSIMEVNLAIVAASIPTLRYLVSTRFPHLFGSPEGGIDETGEKMDDGKDFKDTPGLPHHTATRSKLPTGLEEVRDEASFNDREG